MSETDALKNLDLVQRGPVAALDLFYPRNSPIHTVEVGLSDVRAADSIRITYDFDRDGWSILQASVFSWPADDPIGDADWQEVAFIQAWAREIPDQPTG